MEKQVDKEHYEFRRYIDKRRWASMWHQLDEVLALEPESVLEIGPGPGVFQALVGRFGPRVETLDVDPALKPDHVVPADAMPFEDDAFDVVCAFQVLEHVPYEKSLVIFSEMARVARKGVVISLPDTVRRWPYTFYVPKVGEFKLLVTRPGLRPPRHEFDGEHYWEINKEGYPTARVQQDLEKAGAIFASKTFRVHENPGNQFFVFNKAS